MGRKLRDVPRRYRLPLVCGCRASVACDTVPACFRSPLTLDTQKPIIRAPADGRPARATCYGCFKPRPLCLCRRRGRVKNRTGVIILQHRRESRHPFGTARIAALYLTNVRVEIATCTLDRKVRHAVNLPPGTALLYPGAGGCDLSELPASARPRHLLLLDGTWSQTRLLLRDNPWLSSLPRVGVTPSAPSSYRVRKAPKPGYLSTIEAIALGLQVLEPDTGASAELLTVFDAMISEHLALASAKERSGGAWRRMRKSRKQTSDVAHRPPPAR
jgi:DTW domain-containing protein YfiP